MKNKKIILALILLLAILVGGFWVWENDQSKPKKNNASQNSSNQKDNQIVFDTKFPEEGINSAKELEAYLTQFGQEVKLPKVDTTDWQTFKEDKYGIEFKYPKDWELTVNDLVVKIMNMDTDEITLEDNEALLENTRGNSMLSFPYCFADKNFKHEYLNVICSITFYSDIKNKIPISILKLESKVNSEYKIRYVNTLDKSKVFYTDKTFGTNNKRIILGSKKNNKLYYLGIYGLNNPHEDKAFYGMVQTLKIFD